jgi:hypothetical protein
MWSWILAIVGSTGLFFVGKKNLWGFAVMLLTETLWFIYSFTTHQYGFVFGGVLYCTMYIKAFLNWRKDERKQK